MIKLFKNRLKQLTIYTDELLLL